MAAPGGIPRVRIMLVLAGALVAGAALWLGAGAGSASSHRPIRIIARIRNSYPNFTRLEADCPAGYTLTSGGAEALGDRSILNASIPNAARTGWIAVGHQPGFSSVGLHVFAVCANFAGTDQDDRGPGHRDDVRVARRTRSAYPNFTRLGADCPARYTLTGGGAEALGDRSVLNASIPNAIRTGWIAVGHQPGAGSVGLHVFAVCLENSLVDDERLSAAAKIRPSYPEFTRLEARCRGGTALGGGAEALGDRSILNASIPDRDGAGWIAVGHQPGLGSVGLHTFAVCAAPSGGLG